MRKQTKTNKEGLGSSEVGKTKRPKEERKGKPIKSQTPLKPAENSGRSNITSELFKQNDFLHQKNTNVAFFGGFFFVQELVFVA